ncbi:hypothetical protein NDU88_005620 [Pleurodeles waltl]|uniref:Uncharacterized protein n=1 Tax=Pleurodeles waltl TaxID=8319 RepID=A0AAV7TX42_PLEWA|nr:hypothetical protein NDU88_005620 [Pleurodeles waltl]
MMKMNNGLSAGGGLGEEDAGEDATGERERKREPPRRPANEGPKNSSVKDTATRKEVPEGRELRHVPGGTWLNQVSCGRELEFPATSRVTSGTESQFPDLCDDHDEIGNPGGRIPDSLSEHHGD